MSLSQRQYRAISQGAQINAGESPAYLRHGDGTLEEIVHLGTPPQYTNLWWLQMLLACPRPITVAVHISVGDRRQEKAKQRRRWKRHRSAVLYKERRNQTVGAEEEEVVEEAAMLDQELASVPGATVYRVGIYAAIRDPTGDQHTFGRTVERVCREFQTHTAARVLTAGGGPLRPGSPPPFRWAWTRCVPPAPTRSEVSRTPSRSLGQPAEAPTVPSLGSRTPAARSSG